MVDKNMNIALDKEIEECHINRLKNKPCWTPLHDVVNEFLKTIVKGSHLVSCPWDTPEISNFNHSAVLIAQSTESNTKLKPMKTRRCHDNSAFLLEKGMIAECHTGFALSPDGLWRHHSWGVMSNGIIIETTLRRLVYVSVTINS